MISFAAPGGSVGPHRDNYDVFLCQGIGVREWRFSTDNIVEDTAASDELVLLQEFAGDECHTARTGDVLYLPHKRVINVNVFVDQYIRRMLPFPQIVPG